MLLSRVKREMEGSGSRMKSREHEEEKHRQACSEISPRRTGGAAGFLTGCLAE
jgi:hypothetical protein